MQALQVGKTLSVQWNTNFLPFQSPSDKFWDSDPEDKTVKYQSEAAAENVGGISQHALV